MVLNFPSKAWLLAYKDALNSDIGKAWQVAAKDWEGDFLFVIEPDGGLKEKVVLYIDLHHGECRKAGYRWPGICDAAVGTRWCFRITRGGLW